MYILFEQKRISSGEDVDQHFLLLLLLWYMKILSFYFLGRKKILVWLTAFYPQWCPHPDTLDGMPGITGRDVSTSERRVHVSSSALSSGLHDAFTKFAVYILQLIQSHHRIIIFWNGGRWWEGAGELPLWTSRSLYARDTESNVTGRRSHAAPLVEAATCAPRLRQRLSALFHFLLILLLLFPLLHMWPFARLPVQTCRLPGSLCAVPWFDREATACTSPPCSYTP